MPAAFETEAVTFDPRLASSSRDISSGSQPAPHPYPGWTPNNGFTPSDSTQAHGASLAFGHWFDDTQPSLVPTADQLLPGAMAPDMSDASSATLVASLQHRVAVLYKGYEDALQSVVTALAQPPPIPDDQRPFALQLLALLAEGIAATALGRVGGLIVDHLKGVGSDKLADAAKGAFGGYAKQGGQWAQHATEAAPGANLRHVERAPANAFDLASTTLLADYHALQSAQLRESETNAIDRLLLVQQEASRVSPDSLLLLHRVLTGLAADRAWFEEQVLYGWLNFCAAIALGPHRPEDRTEMPGANGVHGYANADLDATKAWQGNDHDGFIEIVIDVPASIEGTNGLALHSVRVGHPGPGAARILDNMESRSILKVPVYRRITLRTGKSALDSSVAFVLTPDNQLEVDGGNGVLASIGRERRELNKELYDESTGDDAHPTAGALVRADEARHGAAIVATWLGQNCPTTKVAP